MYSTGINCQNPGYLGCLIEFSVLSETIANGEQVSFTGFGSFKVVERSERKGRNPRTGEAMEIAASKNPTFKAGKALKDAVAE